MDRMGNRILVVRPQQEIAFCLDNSAIRNAVRFSSALLANGVTTQMNVRWAVIGKLDPVIRVFNPSL
jgi:hypothetical protein